MDKVTLYTRSSQGLEKVITVAIPNSNPRPVVIQSGERFFVWSNSEQIYLEEYCYVVILTEDDL